MPFWWSQSITSNKLAREAFQNLVRKLASAESKTACHAVFRCPPIQSAFSQSAWTSTGFPIRGVTTQSPDLRVHPGELHSRNSTSNEAVFVEPDPESRAPAVTAQDSLDGRPDPLRLFGRAKLRRAGEEFMASDDKPERGVHRIELGYFTSVGKSIGQHSFRNGASPFDKDIPRLLEPPGRKAETSQGDEGVTPPIAKPRISGDDGFPGPASHQVRVGCLVQNGGKSQSSRLLVPDKFVNALCEDRFMSLGDQDEFGGASDQIKLKITGCGQVFDKIESACLFLWIGEIPIPIWCRGVASVAPGGHSEHSGVGGPRYAISGDFRREVEGRIFVMRAMEIAPREEGANFQGGASRSA